MQARYYDPVIGRFYSNDPVGYTGANPVHSFNRYMYVNNNPYKYVDPNGKFLRKILPKIFDKPKKIFKPKPKGKGKKKGKDNNGKDDGYTSRNEDVPDGDKPNPEQIQKEIDRLEQVKKE